MPSHPLDNPVWHSLAGPHQHLSLSAGRFRRYRPDVGLFAAVEDPDAGFEGLASILDVGDVVGLVTTGPVAVPPGMELVAIADVPQMVADGLNAPIRSAAIVPLNDEHVSAMLELTAFTQPGPFLRRTIETGRYVGVFDGERLVAMAGGRMRAPGFTEVSAVCTHPDYQGRGYAKALVHAIASDIVARGDTPFLHVRAENAVAIATYERLGFAIRRRMQFTVVKRR